MPRLLSVYAVLLLVILFPPSSFAQKSGLPPLPAATAEKAPQATILSIIPAQGEPGITVTLYGNGFTDKTVVFLGNVQLPTTVSSAKQLFFEIPKLSPGLYALYLKTDGSMATRPYNFTVLPLKPVATSLSPDTITSCAGEQNREVTIIGRNFVEGSQVLFDGAAVRSHVASPESVVFTAPQVAGGLHQVQVRNPQDTVSVVLAMTIDDRPEITGVTFGDEYVNYYNLIVQGRNFRQNSTLVVMEERTLEETPTKPAVDVKRITSASANAIEREQLIFTNCSQIIYQRFPYSTTPKSLRLQMVNPGGGESSVVSVSAP